MQALFLLQHVRKVLIEDLPTSIFFNRTYLLDG